jgi:hypothetical protein
MPKKFIILSIHCSYICFLCTSIRAGCFFLAISSIPIIVFPEPGGAAMTPQSIFFILFKISSCPVSSFTFELKSISGSLFLLSDNFYSILDELQKSVRSFKNPLGIFISFFDSEIKLKNFCVP